jgi:hypothetical protein
MLSALTKKWDAARAEGRAPTSPKHAEAWYPFSVD